MALVGLTGVGGGSLMTPLLVLIFGVQATTAVGTDLLYAATTKTVGTVVHHRRGTIDWRVTRRVAIGSIPATIFTLTLLYEFGVQGGTSPPLITIILACALILTAICVVSHRWLRMLTATRRSEPNPPRGRSDDHSRSFPRCGRSAVFGRRRCNRHDHAGPALPPNSDRQACGI
jgi:uncharacterized membrane protein YfcA